MDLEQALTGKDDKAIVQEVERGEDFIKDKFEAALNDNELSSSTKDAVRTAFQSVQAGHARASAMKHSLT